MEYGKHDFINSNKKKPRGRRGLGQEDKDHINFATQINTYETLGFLDCLWWSYDASGENRNAITGGLLKRKGLKAGHSDFSFSYLRDGIAHYLYLEFKIEKGKQSLNQKEFELSCLGDNQIYKIVRSPREGVEVLLKRGIISGFN